MAHATLTKAQGIALLKELTSNDAFRQRFTEKPAAALLELGVPAETIVNLDPACLARSIPLTRVHCFLEIDVAAIVV